MGVVVGLLDKFYIDLFEKRVYIELSGVKWTSGLMLISFFQPLDISELFKGSYLVLTSLHRCSGYMNVRPLTFVFHRLCPRAALWLN